MKLLFSHYPLVASWWPGGCFSIICSLIIIWIPLSIFRLGIPIHGMIKKKMYRDSEIASSCIRIPIKSQKGLISYWLPASWGHILKFAMYKNINDGTHSQSSGTHKDHGPWVPVTHKEVNDFESLNVYWISAPVCPDMYWLLVTCYSKRVISIHCSLVASYNVLDLVHHGFW